MKYFSFIIVVLLFLGCQEVKKPEKPSDLISKDKMVDILTDVYISNASRSINNKLLKDYNIKLDSIIYIKYNIDSLQFVKSNAFYSSNLKTYTTLISTVEERLKILQVEKDSIYEIIKKQKKDTISGKKFEKEGLLVEPVKESSN